MSPAATSAQIAELLGQGLSNKAVAEYLHADPRRIAAVRAGLGLPRARPGRRAAVSLADAFWARAERVDGGHLRWTGCYGGSPRSTPYLRYGGRQLTAYRVAYRIRTGRDPVGYAKPGCEYPGCVEPDHVDDRVTRANRAAIARLLGEGVAS